MKEKKSRLHILNGDSALFQIQKANIAGDTLVWREILCEGPVSENISQLGFWNNRQQFFLDSYEVGSEDYKEKTVKELEKLNDSEKYDELILWFEYDLFCQINLMAALALIHQKKLLFKKVSLVCIGELPGYDRLVGLGEIDYKLFPQLLENRVPLSENDLEKANKVWGLYCSDNPNLILEIADEMSSKFPYLKPSIQAHFKRFPSAFNGLSQIQQEMLKLINTENIETDRQLVGKVLRLENYFGFGDLQYFKIFESLALLIDKKETFSLNQLGEKVISGQENFLDWQKDEFWLGGALNTNFLWNEELNQLVPNNSK